MPAYCHPTAYAAFERELPHVDSTAGLFRAAFAIARHERPDADVARGEATIVDLADTVRRRVHSANIEAKLAHLHDVLFDVVGFVGNVEDYYNPANSYLPDVLRTHRGLPITLVLVYKCVAEQLGLVVRGINSPGHFLAAVQSGEPNDTPAKRDAWMYVDPFFGGELLDRGDVSAGLRKPLAGCRPSRPPGCPGDAPAMAGPNAQQSAGRFRPHGPRTRSVRHAGAAGIADNLKAASR